MVRVGPETHDRVLRERHARKMDFTGRPMKGFVYIVPEGYETDADLQRWVEVGVSYVNALPAKRPKDGAPPRRSKPTPRTRSATTPRRGGRARARARP